MTTEGFLFHELIEWRAGQDPTAVVLVDDSGRSLDWASLTATANRVADALAASGVRVGDRVAIVAPNCFEYIVLYIGAAAAGAIVVPLNTRLAPQEWSFILEDAGPVVLVGHADLAPAVDSIRAELTTIEAFVLVGDEPRSGWTSFGDWTDAATPAARPTVTPSDAALIMYTSGTTGLPKGVVFTHAGLMASLVQMSIALPGLAALRTALIAPMFHVAALFSCLGTLVAGGSIHVLGGFDPEAVVRTLDEGGIGHVSLIPAMVQMLFLLVPDIDQRSFPDLRMISYGGAPMGEETLRQAIDVFGCDFNQAFGQTEAPFLTFLGAAEHRLAASGDGPERLRSCGRPAPGIALRVVDEDGKDVPLGEVGEVIVSGPQVMAGYWRRPELTAEVVVDGWLHTGDAGRLDEDGRLYLSDRIKDMIITGGENVYPIEVERVLATHPAVADVAVIAVPDERWGEAVHAVVQLREPDQPIDLADLTAHCDGQLAGFKHPRSVEFVATIPRNASMKILKRELREPHWHGRERLVH